MANPLTLTSIANWDADSWTKTDQLSLSVIIPVYNERHLVAASVGRVLALEHEYLSDLEVIIVDDCSTDGSWKVLQRLAAADDRIRLLQHAQNRGKGDAIRTAIPHAKNDVTVIHDADLEYDPQDILAILEPFLMEGADAVFGSRYFAGNYRRALGFKHSVMNRGITWMSNWFTDLDLTDVETCYKAVRTPLLKSIPIRSNDFRFEIELASKLSKRRARVFEVPIQYQPRSYAEGKKIGALDGALALKAIIKHWLIDDLFTEDEYGSHMLGVMDKTPRFNLWLGDTIRPFVGERVLELGAGIGTLSEQLIPRPRYVAAEANPNFLRFLRSYALGKPYVEIVHIDPATASDFTPFGGQFDTVILSNVLERQTDPAAVLANAYGALEPGGRVVVLVPRDGAEKSGRFTDESLRSALEEAGFVVEQTDDFDRASVPSKLLNGKLLRKRSMSRLHLKLFDTLIPALRRVERRLPWRGQSIVAVAKRPATEKRS